MVVNRVSIDESMSNEGEAVSQKTLDYMLNHIPESPLDVLEEENKLSSGFCDSRFGFESALYETLRFSKDDKSDYVMSGEVEFYDKNNNKIGSAQAELKSGNNRNMFFEELDISTGHMLSEFLDRGLNKEELEVKVTIRYDESNISLIERKPYELVSLIGIRDLETNIETYANNPRHLESFKNLVKLLEKKDPYTRGHSRRVAEYSRSIAENMPSYDIDTEEIYLAGYLHDMGKNYIDDSILKKPDKLTDDEFSKMKEHAQIGYQMISAIPSMKHVSESIRYHHEREDGNGYYNVPSKNIPIESKILAVADTYDAMTSDRPYRKGMSKKKAIRILEEEKGKQFDSYVVDVFVERVIS